MQGRASVRQHRCCRVLVRVGERAACPVVQEQRRSQQRMPVCREHPWLCISTSTHTKAKGSGQAPKHQTWPAVEEGAGTGGKQRCWQ